MSKRILVVEDQEDNRQIIRDMLAATNYEITEAENGEQALAAIAKERPDLILMDIQLPIMDGYTATRPEYKAHQEKMAAEREHHESWMSAAKSEFEFKAKAAKDALGQLAAGKQALSSELQRRLDVINQPIS
jgi:CheY-like chemotaxis protein